MLGVLDRAREGLPWRLRQPKIQDPHPAIPPNQHVVRFEIAVHNPRVVGSL